MDNTRRISTPTISDSPVEEPFHNFRSLRSHRSHNQIKKIPEVSVILEVDTDHESSEERTNKNEIKQKPRPASMNSTKFDIEQPKRQNSTRDSRRSTRSVSTISTKSLNLTKATKYGSSSSHNGDFNRGFQNSNTNLNRSLSSLHSNVTTTPVVREQYFCCRKWSKREKILTIIVVTLVFLVCGLVIAIGVVSQTRAEKNREKFLLKL